MRSLFSAFAPPQNCSSPDKSYPVILQSLFQYDYCSFNTLNFKYQRHIQKNRRVVCSQKSSDSHGGNLSTGVLEKPGDQSFQGNPRTTFIMPLEIKPFEGSIGIVNFFKGKNYLITGATGFVAKVIVEKILRMVPEAGKIFVLIKAKDKEAAMERLKAEIIECEVFKKIKEAHGKRYMEFMIRKLVPVVGTVCQSDLGMDAHTANDIAKQVHVVINSAATTSFDERYEVALNTNAKGPFRLLNFAKKCKNLCLFFHISTDVRIWIGEVRGKDFAETYAWSYKRRYKTGYVWQDLLDDDLITPISDNEYVLKGSQIQPPSFENFMFGERKASILNEEIPVQVHNTDCKQQKQKQPLIPQEQELERFPCFKTNSLYQLSLTDKSECRKVEPDKLVNTGKPKKNESNKTDTPETSFSISLSTSSSSSLSPAKGNSKRFSTGASGLIRNLIHCGALDSKDDVSVVLNEAHKTVLSKNSIILDDNTAQIRKHERFGGSARNLGTSWNPKQNEEARKSCDDQKSTNKNKKKLGKFQNQISHKPFGGGSIFFR